MKGYCKGLEGEKKRCTTGMIIEGLELGGQPKNGNEKEAEEFKAVLVAEQFRVIDIYRQLQTLTFVILELDKN